MCTSAEPFFNLLYYHPIGPPPQPTIVRVSAVNDSYRHKIDYVKEFPIVPSVSELRISNICEYACKTG